MTDKIEVTLSHPHQGGKPGDKVSVTRGEAKTLIRAGVAVATKPVPPAPPKK